VLLQLTWVESNDLEEVTATTQPEAYAAGWAKLKEADGILVPGTCASRMWVFGGWSALSPQHFVFPHVCKGRPTELSDY